MESKKYQKIVDKHAPIEQKGTNLIIAFIVGGTLGVLADLLMNVYAYYFHIPTQEAGTWMLLTFIITACLLTGLGILLNHNSDIKIIFSYSNKLILFLFIFKLVPK